MAHERSVNHESKGRRSSYALSSSGQQTAYRIYFANTRMKLDFSYWVFLLSIVVALCASNSVNFFQCVDEREPTTTTMPAAASTATKSIVTAFPCDSSLFSQALWTASSLPTVLLHMATLHSSWVLLSFYLLGMVYMAALVLAPRWYAEAGRSYMVAASRLLPRAVGLLELLLSSKPQMTLAWIQACSIGSKGWQSMIFEAMMLPVGPSLTDCRTAWLTDCWALQRAAPMYRIAAIIDRHDGWPSLPGGSVHTLLLRNA